MWTKYSAHVNFVVSSIFLMIILLFTSFKTILSFLSIIQCWGLPSKFHLFVYMTNLTILRQHCWCTEYHLHICQLYIWSAHFDPRSPCKHCELCSQLSINCFVAFWGTPNCNLWPTWEVWNTTKGLRIPSNALATLQGVLTVFCCALAILSLKWNIYYPLSLRILLKIHTKYSHIQ